MNIVGFTGIKGSGKDTAAQALDQHKVVKFAGALKEMLSALLRYQGCPEDRIERYLEGDLKGKPCPYLAGRSMRYAMQTLGTEWGRNKISADLWIGAVENHIEHFAIDRVVLTDVRFRNEVDFVSNRGGDTYRVDRGLKNIDLHPSEYGIIDLPVRAVIPNDGTVDELHERVLNTVGIV